MGRLGRIRSEFGLRLQAIDYCRSRVLASQEAEGEKGSGGGCRRFGGADRARKGGVKPDTGLYQEKGRMKGCGPFLVIGFAHLSDIVSAVVGNPHPC